MRFFFNLFDFMCNRYNGMKNFACQKAFQDLEMDALMSLWSGNRMSINQEWPVRRLHIILINSY